MLAYHEVKVVHNSETVWQAAATPRFPILFADWKRNFEKQYNGSIPNSALQKQNTQYDDCVLDNFLILFARVAASHHSELATFFSTLLI